MIKRTLPDGKVVEIDDGAAPARVITPREFMDRLSETTRRGIVAAGNANADVRLLVDTLLGGDIDLDSDRTRAGVAAMQAAKLITAAEAKALLA